VTNDGLSSQVAVNRAACKTAWGSRHRSDCDNRLGLSTIDSLIVNNSSFWDTLN